VRGRRNNLHSQLALAGLTLALVGGCSLRHSTWTPPEAVTPVELTSLHEAGSGLSFAQSQYDRAVKLEEAGRAECVDHYFMAATLAWPAIECVRPGIEETPEWQLYHSAVAQMLIAAQEHRRWQPECGLLVNRTTGLTPVVASYQGFAWQPSDFTQLAPVGHYSDPSLKYKFRAGGLGVPLAVVRRSNTPEPFMQPTQSFAATVVLRPASGCDSTSNRFVLEFINPVSNDTISTSCGTAPLARDITAPFAYPPRGRDRDWLTDFILPGSSTRDDGLFLLEPYQPGKIPVVFVHGLLSDPLTWTDMVNQLRAHRDLTDRYQFWAFRYSTGTQFFRSAALLRRQLAEVQQAYDPCHEDPAFTRMVIVGHSMGGLLAKLQITYSGDALWNTLANRPPDMIVTTPDVRNRLVEQLYFDPNPNIARVVYIGTPHQGSEDATRCMGRVGAALVETPPEIEQQHAQLLRDNPGAFHNDFRHYPRSIDLLEPGNPFLQTTLRLPYRQGIAVHSICGVADRPCSPGPTDGVVPLSSARLYNVQSEKIVGSKHTDLTRDKNSIAEVARILRLHAR
jgi:pimeloyl-ACP methyl ester carboxylesterase